jgi:hypothetical protein
MEPPTRPKTATQIQTGYGRIPIDDEEIPAVFLRISTVSEPDVIYALETSAAREMAYEILDRTIP